MAGFQIVTSDTAKAESTGSGNNDFDLDKWLAGQQADIDLMETQDSSEVLSGVVSGYIDLGIQPRGEYEEEYDENNKEHAEKLEKDSFLEERYNGQKKKRMQMLCTPRSDAKAFVLTVDFPDYMKEHEFKGEKTVKPFRMYMGGDWRVNDPDNPDRKMKIVQNPMYMTENTNNPQNAWALGTTTSISKMCVAAGLANEHGLVKAEQIGNLLGKTLQFEVRVWNKPDKKDASKSYYTENIKFVGKLPKGMPEKTLPEGCIFGVNFQGENDPAMVKQVRALAKNTMKLASNWEGSDLKGQMFGEGGNTSQQVSNSTSEAPQKQQEKTSPKVEASVPDKVEPSQSAAEDDEFLDDIPF